MLKVEKTPQKQDFVLLWRKKEPWFNRLFLQALLAALFLHLGLFFLFRIQSFKTDSAFIFAPILLQTDSLQPSISLTAQLEPQNTEQMVLQDIPSSFSTSFPHLKASYHDLGLKISHITFPDSFESLETRLKLFHDSNFLEKPPFFHLVLSGLLGHASLHHVHLKQLTSTLERLTDQGYLRVEYQILVAQQTGQICWYEQKLSTGNKRIDQLIEKWLLNLRFSNLSKEPFIEGKIELILALKQGAIQ